MAIGGKVLRIGALSVLLLVAATGAWVVRSQPGEPKFCKASLAILVIDGHEVVPQDQGNPGRDGCDFGEIAEHYDRTLGFDCKIRTADGEVETELVPNRRDGTCGLAGVGDPTIPDPWPER